MIHKGYLVEKKTGIYHYIKELFQNNKILCMLLNLKRKIIKSYNTYCTEYFHLMIKNNEKK